ncbi:MAG: T9SS type A sorting domain-containing protein [Bacteroidetes bacterium]|nr:T9SS type A sorting domain-containing protein [Bacteroidota bacterium]
MKNFTFQLRILFFLVVFGSFAINSFAKNIITSEDNKTALQFVSVNDQQLVLLNKVGVIKTEFVNINNEEFVRLAVPSYTRSTVFGNPEMPVRRKMIEIPFGATPVINIINYDVAEYSLADYGIENSVYPLQFPVPKCGDSPEYVCNNEMYQVDAFLSQELVTVDILGVMRGTRIARINIAPIFYNPVKNTIRVYENLEFEIVFEGADLELTQAQKEKYYSPYFSGMLTMLDNYTKPSSRENFTTYPIKYVIVSDRMFEDQLQPFIEWKTKKGFTVVEAYTDEIGTTKPAIKTYIQDLYEAGTTEDPAPSFVLFVGDVAQIPTYENGNGETDRLYFEYTGDLFPEIFYGRFSAQNTTQLQPYIDKTLQYEQYTMPDPAFLEEVVMIAGMDGGFGASHGNGQINYGTVNYFNEEHDILSHTYLYPNSGSNAANIRQDISNGVSFANYTAHCSPSGWADPSFVTSHISALQNQDKYGLLIGNCCSSSEFAGNCFGEEILRAENKGAVGYIGGSNSTYWDEDYWFGVGSTSNVTETPPPYENTGLGNYDRSFHDHGEDFEEWFTTMGQTVYAGNFAVSDAGSSLETYYWDIYNLMGDPSLMIYYGVPDPMTVTHPSAIMFGQTTTSIDAAPYAYISITMDNVIYGVALADENGHADIELEAFPAPGLAEIVVTAQNFEPYISSIDVIPAEGPFIIYAEHVINDATGNDNGMIDCGESILLDFTIENVGVEEAEVEVEIGTDNPYVTMIDSTESFGNVLAEGEMTVEDAFSFTMANNVPDQTVITFSFMATVPDREDFESTFTDIANAPALAIEFMNVDDSEGGNDNGRLDAGETVNMVYHAWNNGHTISADAIMNLTSSSSYITVNTASVELGPLEVAGYMEASFEIVAAEDAPVGVLANFSTDLVADAYSAAETTLLPIGLIVEDFETGDFTSFDWTFSGNADWEIINIGAYEGIYSAKSGDINDNQNSVLELVVDVPMDDVVSFYKKVSSESGYDELRFYIDGSEKGSWDGNVAWSFEEYAITEGEHTLKWEYDKDGSQSSGSDCAWLDYIILPSAGLAPLFADFTSDIQNVYEIPDVNFTSNSVGDITGYEWTFEGGEPETSTEERPMVSYYVPGVYDVTLTVTDGENENTIVKEDYITVHYWVGFEERDDLMYKLYPNPSNGMFTLEVNSEVQVEVRNTVGSLVYVNSQVTSKERIDLSQQAKGVYFVTVKSKTQSFVEKIVISK